MTPRTAPIALAAALLAAATAAIAEDWSRFRGPNGSGVSPSTGLPVEFGDENRRWVTDVPFGRSSPVIGGDRIYLTAATENELLTLAVDRASGEVLWQRGVTREHTADLHGETDSATATAVTDGDNVYVFFHEAGLVSYDAAGRERWRKSLGSFRNYYGCASSPIAAEGLVIVLCDQAAGSFLLAVDAGSGEERWRVERPARLESYSTPILYPATGTPTRILVSGSRWVDAYDLATGESVWTVAAVGTGPVASPVLTGDALFVSAHDHADDGWPEFEPLLAEHDADEDGELSPAEVEEVWLGNHFGWLDNDADGTLTASDWQRLRDEVVNDTWGIFAIDLAAEDGPPRKLWNYRQNVPYIPSPVVYEGVYYMVKDGIVTALDSDSGELLKRGRLPGTAKVHASPVAADGKIYVSTLEGRIDVLEAGADWKVLASSELGEPIRATPAILDGKIYVRTESRLWCFAADTADSETALP